MVGVACVPGDNFYGNKLDPTTKNKYLRFAACRSDGDLDKAIQLLNEKLWWNVGKTVVEQEVVMKGLKLYTELYTTKNVITTYFLIPRKFFTLIIPVSASSIPYFLFNSRKM